MSSTTQQNPRDPLARFVSTLEQLTGATGQPESTTVDGVAAAMRELVAHDDWLDEAMTKPHPQFYQQYLLHADPQGRFSVVSFVWGPGQKTPIHDHCTWGVIGMLRGAEVGEAYSVGADGKLVPGASEQLNPGDVGVVSPTVGDIHVVRNVYDDRVSISIHAYGVDIGQQRRHVYDPVTGAQKEFISGYANVAKAAS